MTKILPTDFNKKEIKIGQKIYVAVESRMYKGIVVDIKYETRAGKYLMIPIIYLRIIKYDRDEERNYSTRRGFNIIIYEDIE